jgi:flagellar motor switch protein FliN/FliY
MTTEAALQRLVRSAADAALGVLGTFVPDQVEAGDVAVLDGSTGPLEGLPFPAVATSVSYVDGVTGGNLFVMTVEGAKRLAAAMGAVNPPFERPPIPTSLPDSEPSEEPSSSSSSEASPEEVAAVAPAPAPLTDAELNFVSEAMSKMMTGAAAAISAVLDSPVDIGSPETRIFESVSDTKGAYPNTPHVVRAAFSVCGEPCRLVQLVPNAFVVRMTHALEELSTMPDLDGLLGGDFEAAPTASAPSLHGIPVRVWAELGRASMPTADVVGLPSGAVVELNRAADDAIDLFVNGRRFATGRLVVVDGTDWGVRIESLVDPSSPENDPELEIAHWPDLG